MGRKTGSKNKHINFETIDKLNIQLIYDSKYEYSKGEKMDKWFYRLVELTKNMPYIIAVKRPIEGSKPKYRFSDFVDENLIQVPNTQLVSFSKPTGRVNDTMSEDIEDFMHAIVDAHISKYGKHNENNHLDLCNDLKKLLTITQKTIKDTEAGNFKRLFLLHDGQLSKMLTIKADIEIASTADLDIISHWHRGWLEFWHEMERQLISTIGEFRSPSFKLRNGIKINNKEFQKWAETGLLKFIEPTSFRRIDDASTIRLLKKVILNNYYPKSK